MSGRLGVLTFLVLSVVACGDSGTGPDNIFGRYNLVSIDGDPPPAVILESGTTVVEMTDMFISLQSSGAIVSEFDLRAESAGQTLTETETRTGTWLLSGSSVELVWDDGCSDTATIAGDRLSYIGCGTGLSFVLER